MFPDALWMARGRIRADSQNGKANNGTSACFVIYRSGEGRNTKKRQERENGSEIVLYTQAQGSMDKCYA